MQLNAVYDNENDYRAQRIITKVERNKEENNTNTKEGQTDKQ